ncbi:MAG TPA: alpha/beta hydrolase, partial [Planctomycetota bacterium]|nr:alpha/beta hydrolase [Planctomycetota bacterium]
WAQTSRFFSYWLSQPPKVVFQLLFLNGMGQGAFQVMLQRTRHLFHGPDEYGLSHDERDDPAAAAAHVAGQKKRLHAFFDALAAVTCADGDAHGCWEITLVGHSMGAIVINEVLSTYPDLPVKNIVYMAPACPVRDAQKVIVPYLLRHRRARFFLLTLHPIAEADEKFSVLPWYDVVPRGSLLEWVDNWYTAPASEIDRTLGKWLNVIPAIWLFEAVRDRVYIKSFDVGSGGPEKHGDFNGRDFWRPEFWWDESVAR